MSAHLLLASQEENEWPREGHTNPFAPVGVWVSYAIIVAPMIAILSHREINVDPLLRWILYTIMALTPILPSRV
jgi:hypothetical protein